MPKNETDAFPGEATMRLVVAVFLCLNFLLGSFAVIQSYRGNYLQKDQSGFHDAISEDVSAATTSERSIAARSSLEG
jgi:hypothetical protein